MAIGQTALTVGDSATNASSYTTASVTPGANKLILVSVASKVSGAVPNEPTLSGNGLTYVAVASISYGNIATPRQRVTTFRAMGSAPTSGVITIDFAGQTQEGCVWSVSEFSGTVTSGTNGSDAVVQSATNRADTVSSLTVTLAAFGSASNATYGAFAVAATTNMTPGTGFTEIHDQVVTGDQPRLLTEWRSDNDTSVDASGPTNHWGGVAVEIRAVIEGAATFSASGQMSGAATAVYSGAGTIAATGQMSALGGLILSGAAAFSAAGSMRARASVRSADVAMPTLKVEVAWSNDPLDTPTSSEWTDITSRLREFTCTRGRAHELDRFSAGTARLRADNSDRGLDPLYGGPYGRTAMVLDGTGDFASTSDHASLGITGDIEIGIAVALDAPTAAVAQSFVVKHAATSYAWDFEGVADTLRFTWWDGAAQQTREIVLNPLPAAGEWILLWMTLDVDNGAGGHDYKCYRKTPDGSSLLDQLKSGAGRTQVGSTLTTAGTTAIAADSAPLRIGVNESGAAGLDGKVGAAVERNGIDGTVATDPDFSFGRSEATTSFTDATGKTWTLNGNAAVTLDQTNLVPRRRLRASATHSHLDRPGFDFDGASYFAVASYTSFPTTEVTFEAWVLPDATSNNEALFDFAAGEFRVSLDGASREITVSVDQTVTASGIGVATDLPTHIAALWRSRDGLLRVFRNGELAFEKTGVKTGVTLASSGALRIGYTTDAVASSFYNGRMREARLWSVAKTHHAIHAGMYRTVGGDANLASYWPFDDASGTTAADVRANQDATLTGNQGWITMTGARLIYTGVIESIEPHWKLGDTDAEVVMTCSDLLSLLGQIRSSVISPYRRAVLDRDPYLYWPLDTSGKTVTDSSGNARDGTASNTGVADMFFPLGDTGKGMRITPPAVVVAGSGVANFERTQAFSGACVVKFTGDPVLDRWTIMRALQSGSTERGWRFSGRVFEGVTFKIANDDAANNEIQKDGYGQIMDGFWHHLAFTYDGTSTAAGVKLYLDGEVMPSKVITDALSATTAGTGTFAVGPQTTESESVFEVAHVAVWSSALTASQIRSLYAAAFEPWESQRTDERVTSLMTLLELPTAETALRRGVAAVGPIVAPIGNVADQAHGIAEIERGALYVTEHGTLVLDDRYANSFDSPIVFVYGDASTEVAYSRIEASFDHLDLGTEVVVRKTPDGTAIRKADSAAATRFAPRSIALEGPWLADAYAEDAASYMLTRASTINLRFEVLGFSPGPRDWAALLNARLHRDRVQVIRRPVGGGTITRNCWVERITHDMRSGRWITTLGLVPDDGTRSDLFTLGRSALDGTAVLA